MWALLLRCPGVGADEEPYEQGGEEPEEAQAYPTPMARPLTLSM